MKNKSLLMLSVLMVLAIFLPSLAIGGKVAPDKAAPRTSKSKRVASLPKVLIIGDSISGGYSKPLTKLMDGKVEVVKLGAVATYRINKEAFWHSRGIAKALDFGSAKACIADFERFERHLSETKYDVIHFNFGLNDIFRGRKGAWHNPTDQYAKDLAKIVTLLKKNGAKVIWASTTPIPVNDPHRPEGDELIYNAAAEKVMKKNNIPINDLHSVVTGWDGYAKWKKGDNVHFGGAVYSKLAKQVAEKISAQLELDQVLTEPANPAKGETSEYFSNWPAGKSPAEIGKKVSEHFLTTGHYQKFKSVVYPEICTWYGAFRIARQTGDNALAEKLVRRFDRYLKPQNAKRFPYNFHVDHCVNGVVPLEIYRLTKDEQYLKLGMKRADYQWEKTTADGITRQARYWVDDIYMISAIQTAAYRVTGEMKYLDRAALTTSTYIKKLQQPDGLFFHAADSPFYWGRGVGWFAAGMTEILRALPKDHPHYGPIMKGYRKMMAALLKHQSDSGLWRQLVDKPEAWYETSSTGMYTYAIVTGVKRGWLDEKSYGPVARKAWLALVDNLDENYNMKNVCVGTNKAAMMVGKDLDTQHKYYLARPRCTGDYHGQAPVLWTAAAMLE